MMRRLEIAKDKRPKISRHNMTIAVIISVVANFERAVKRFFSVFESLSTINR
jgi:hypothetical protein